MPSIIHDIFVSACLSPYSVNSFIHNKEYDLAQITTDTLFFFFPLVSTHPVIHSTMTVIYMTTNILTSVQRPARLVFQQQIVVQVVSLKNKSLGLLKVFEGENKNKTKISST